MKSKHSWNWLVPRFINRRSSSFTSRQDSHRATLSGSGEVGGPQPAERFSPRHDDSCRERDAAAGDTQVLIGLLQGGLSVTADEINLLKACATGKHIDKLVIESRRLDGELVKIGQEVTKGELTDQQRDGGHSQDRIPRDQAQ